VSSDEFESALNAAYDTPWWRMFINVVKKRRSAMMEQLAIGMDDQRSEDRARGQISELAFIVGLDEVARANREHEKETKRARAQVTTAD